MFEAGESAAVIFAVSPTASVLEVVLILIWLTFFLYESEVRASTQ
jgi:hypothetical protein